MSYNNTIIDGCDRRMDKILNHLSEIIISIMLSTFSTDDVSIEIINELNRVINEATRLRDCFTKNLAVPH